MEKDTIGTNCAALLLFINNKDSAFTAAVRKDYRELCATFKPPAIESPIWPHSGQAFIDEIYTLMVELKGMCSVTQQSLPPVVPTLTSPDLAKYLSVVRLTAWLINIEVNGVAGYFNCAWRQADLKQGMHDGLSVKDDYDATVKQRRGYVTDLMDAFVVTVTSTEEEFIIYLAENTPVWWTPDKQRMMISKFNRTYKDLYE